MKVNSKSFIVIFTLGCLIAFNEVSSGYWWVYYNGYRSIQKTNQMEDYEDFDSEGDR